MVAVAILAVIAVLALAAYSRVIVATQKAETSNNMRNLYIAITNYANDNGGRLPDNGKQGKPFWDVQLFPYLSISSEGLEGLPSGPVTSTGLDETFKVFTNSADQVPRIGESTYPRSYAMRAWTNNHNFGSPSNPITAMPGQPDRGGLLALVEQPSRASLMVETFQPANEVGSGAFFLQGIPSEAGTTVDSPDWMHDGISFVLFLDGHVEGIRAEDVSPVDQGPYWPVRD